jgi:cytochrome c-type biogenesis protein CcmH
MEKFFLSIWAKLTNKYFKGGLMRLLVINFAVALFFIFLLNSSFATNKVYDISNELMCPVCQGQTVAESNSQLALSMKEVIKIKVSKGESKKEILDYFISQYGETILAKPPLKGFSLLLWLSPPLILVGSIIFWIRIVRKNKKKV